MEKYLEINRPVFSCFLDYTKAFDSVWHDDLRAVLCSLKVRDKLINLLKNVYVKSQLAVKIGTTLGDWSRAEIRSRLA